MPNLEARPQWTIHLPRRTHTDGARVRGRVRRRVLALAGCLGLLVGAWSSSAARAEPASRSGGGAATATVLRCAAPTVQKVALTFDDGPTRKHTTRMLAILKQHKVKATFFVLGGAARQGPELLKRIIEEGHLVATHSYSHPKKGSLEDWRKELRRTAEVIEKAGVKLSPYFRPPHGIITPQVKQAAGELGYSIILYTLLSSDWTRPGAAALTKQVVRTMAPGGIVVMHDGGGDRSQTVEALPEIIRGLRKKGLEPVRLDELLGPKPEVIESCARAAR